MTEKSKRRWFSFSLRAMFVVVTLVCMAIGWLGVQIKWIHNRHQALQWLVPLHARQLAAASGSLLPSKKGAYVSHSGIKAPWSLEVMGELGIERIEVDPACLNKDAPFTLHELRSLFPEADVTAATKR